MGIGRSARGGIWVGQRRGSAPGGRPGGRPGEAGPTFPALRGGGGGGTSAIPPPTAPSCATPPATSPGQRPKSDRRRTESPTAVTYAGLMACPGHMPAVCASQLCRNSATGAVCGLFHFSAFISDVDHRFMVKQQRQQ